MKTSMNLLKAGDACTGGYGRQATFMTVRPAVKNIEYPIWLVGLTGSLDDLKWAISNGMVIDPVMFKAFREKSFMAVWSCLFWEHQESIIQSMTAKTRSEFRTQLVNEWLSVRTRDQAESMLEKWKYHNIHTTMITQVLGNQLWSSPADYLHYVIDHINTTIPPVAKAFDKGDIKDATSWETWRLKQKDSEDWDSSPKKYKRAAVKANVKVTAEPRYFETPAGVSPAEAFAWYVVGSDPYAAAIRFVNESQLAKLFGTKVEVFEEATGKFRATIELDNAELIFKIMHLLQAKQFNLLGTLSAENQLTRVKDYLRREGFTDALSSFADFLEGALDNSSSSKRRSLQMLVNGLPAPGAPVIGSVHGHGISVGIDDEEDDDEDRPRPGVRAPEIRDEDEDEEEGETADVDD